MFRSRTVPPITIVLLVAAGCAVYLSGFQSTSAPPKPKRINRAIELLEQGQPIYYTQVNRGGYDEGVEMAQTWADYIT